MTPTLRLPRLAALAALPCAILYLETPLGAVDFESQVLPIFEANCAECHHAPREERGRLVQPRAGLRFDAAWAIERGSENGPVIEAGDPEASELYRRITLSGDDSDAMPPRTRRSALAADEIALLKEWIEQGAEFGDWVGNLDGKPDSEAPSAPAVVLTGLQAVYEALAEGLPEIRESDWAAIEERGARVTRLSASYPLLEVDFRLAPERVDAETLALLEPLAPHLAHLDLSGTSVGDGDLGILARTPRLVRLNLSRTSIGDEAMRSLSSLGELRFLNLHRSQVGDAGLRELRSLKQLEALYLWQTEVTPRAVARLQEALPETKINFR